MVRTPVRTTTHVIHPAGVVASLVALMILLGLVVLVGWWLVAQAMHGGGTGVGLMAIEQATPVQVMPSPAPPVVAPAMDDAPAATFNDRPLRKVGDVRMRVTAYSPDARSCGKWADGVTASGYSVWTNGMKLVAADTDVLPFGSIVTVPGYNDGRPVPVLDRGGRIKGDRLDVLYPTHEAALQWGVQQLTVTVWEYAD